MKPSIYRSAIPPESLETEGGFFGWVLALVPGRTKRPSLDKLDKGPSDARGNPGTRSVPLSRVKAVFRFVSRRGRAMIERQPLTGTRSGEVTIERGPYLNRDDACVGRIHWRDPHEIAHHKAAPAAGSASSSLIQFRPPDKYPGDVTSMQIESNGHRFATPPEERLCADGNAALGC